MRLRALALAATVAACEVDAPRPRAPCPPPAAPVAESARPALPATQPPEPAQAAPGLFVPRDLGCFPDHGDPEGTRGRDLDGFFTDRKDMTNELCAAICSSKGFVFAGTQSSTQCFCGNHYGRYAPGGRCGDRCAGDVYEICGGSWSNLIYSVRPAPAVPVPEPDQR
jgi:hypothetical protein